MQDSVYSNASSPETLIITQTCRNGKRKCLHGGRLTQTQYVLSKCLLKYAQGGKA